MVRSMRTLNICGYTFCVYEYIPSTNSFNPGRLRCLVTEDNKKFLLSWHTLISEKTLGLMSGVAPNYSSIDEKFLELFLTPDVFKNLGFGVYCKNSKLFYDDEIIEIHDVFPEYISEDCVIFNFSGV